MNHIFQNLGIPNWVQTLEHCVAATTFAHRISDLPSPVDASAVQLALGRATHRKPRRAKQAQGLTTEILDQILSACPTNLIGLRNAALIAVGYDTLCRSSELAAMCAEQLNLGTPDARIFIPHSNCDTARDGHIAFLSDRTRQTAQAWLTAADLEPGPFFRGLSRGVPSEAPLDTSTIHRRIKHAANRAGLPHGVATKASGHSMRIGAAQDMMTTDLDSHAIMQSGGWETSHVLMQYVENAPMWRLRERR